MRGKASRERLVGREAEAKVGLKEESAMETAGLVETAAAARWERRDCGGRTGVGGCDCEMETEGLRRRE
ncbi:hypothetical protein E2562_028501 [Oryza meyeriana var. granulata]|uniref:DUF834 domain-containing protein n=1 Tax=Oryza meyeriana var. granulata TaxID=110450 RepID=A0A6G1DRW9_9ORYZ|nr:hypothetical protein E2562_028501 [Oryza meyeriana var. granulata]